MEGAVAVSRARRRRAKTARGRPRGARYEARARAAARCHTQGKRAGTCARRASCARPRAARRSSAQRQPYLRAERLTKKCRRSRVAPRRARGGRQCRNPRSRARQGRSCASLQTSRGETTPRYARRARAARGEERVERLTRGSSRTDENLAPLTRRDGDDGAARVANSCRSARHVVTIFSRTPVLFIPRLPVGVRLDFPGAVRMISIVEDCAPYDSGKNWTRHPRCRARVATVAIARSFSRQFARCRTRGSLVLTTVTVRGHPTSVETFSRVFPPTSV